MLHKCIDIARLLLIHRQLYLGRTTAKRTIALDGIQLRRKSRLTFLRICSSSVERPV